MPKQVSEAGAIFAMNLTSTTRLTRSW